MSLRAPCRLSVFLDIDETLIYASDYDTGTHSFEIDVEDKHFFIIARPGLHEFLWNLKRSCDVYVYTSSVWPYATSVIQGLGMTDIVKRVLVREDCEQNDAGMYLKDVAKGGTPLKRTILVDDQESALAARPENAILVSPFRGDAHDTELSRVWEKIKSLLNVTDVCSALRSSHGLKRRNVI
jgi:import inner membrane translocase subunit TIM50